ncbi:hypothetical protein MKX01_014212 [Papaver californicum]|nr:hypothetical protein MKX01_014212 [Papaver californicum]
MYCRWKLIALDVGTMQRRGGVKAAKHLAIFLSVHLVNIEALFKVLDEGNQLKELNNLYKEFRTPAEPAIRLEIGMLLLQHHYWLPLNFSITYIWRAYMVHIQHSYHLTMMY